jgi:hypothetical protein
LLRFARNDATTNGCHCEERSDEAISSWARFPVFPVEAGIFDDFLMELPFDHEKDRVYQALADKFP